MMIFLFWLLFAAAVGAWARAWGYNFAFWGGMAVVISPLIAAIILLATGPDKREKPASPDLYNRDEPINL